MIDHRTDRNHVVRAHALGAIAADAHSPSRLVRKVELHGAHARITDFRDLQMLVGKVTCQPASTAASRVLNKIGSSVYLDIPHI